MNTTATHRLHPDLVVLTQAAPVPGRGFLPIASYLLLGKQPVLVDTGAAATARASSRRSRASSTRGTSRGSSSRMRTTTTPAPSSSSSSAPRRPGSR